MTPQPFHRLQHCLHEHNRKIVVEAVTTLAVGLVSCIVVFGGTFWLVWLFSLFGFTSFKDHALSIAMGLTATLLVLSFWYAWRQVDPIENVDIDPETADRKQLERAIGFHMGVPVFHRESIAGIASLMIGGPANLLDACSLWRSRIAADDAIIAAAEQILQKSRSPAGTPASRTSNPQAIALLHRLGLIKSRGAADGGIVILATQKGLNVLDG